MYETTTKSIQKKQTLALGEGGGRLRDKTSSHTQTETETETDSLPHLFWETLFENTTAN